MHKLAFREPVAGFAIDFGFVKTRAVALVARLLNPKTLKFLYQIYWLESDCVDQRWLNGDIISLK
jgi:hypothetical protein